MPEYFLAYIISGEAKKYHRAITEKIARTIRVESAYLPKIPHITLKSPFQTDNIIEIENIIEKIAQDQAPFTFEMSGFNNFDDRVLYMDLAPCAHLELLTQQLLDAVSASGIQPSYCDFIRIFHASIATGCSIKDFSKIKKFLRPYAKRPREFKVCFGSISIFDKTLHKVHKTYPLTGRVIT